MNSTVIHDADAVSAAEPEPVVDVIDRKHLIQRSEVNQFVRIVCVFNFLVQHDSGICFAIDVAGLFGIRIKRCDTSDPVIFMAEEIADFSVFQNKSVTGICDAVNLSILAGVERLDECFVKAGIIHERGVEVLIQNGQSAGCADIDSSFFIFRDCSDGGGTESVRGFPLTQIIIFHQEEAAFVCADPKTSLGIVVQTFHAGDAGCGIHSFECVAVIADQTRIAADP